MKESGGSPTIPPTISLSQIPSCNVVILLPNPGRPPVWRLHLNHIPREKGMLCRPPFPCPPPAPILHAERCGGWWRSRRRLHYDMTWYHKIPAIETVTMAVTWFRGGRGWNNKGEVRMRQELNSEGMSILIKQI